MIVLTNLVKRFGTIEAVKGLSFEVKRGEIFGLLGPNGAGKSTTINMLTGLISPDAGLIKFDGLDDISKAATRKSIGVAPQALAVYDELTAEENLRFFGRLYELSGKELSTRVTLTLDVIGLADRKADRVATYSGGMKRRLNLGCALLHDPTLLFFDEPTVGVDPQSRMLILEKIHSLKGQDRTIVYTTHYMEEAERLCDRIAIMDHGVLLDCDTVPKLIARHGGKSVVKLEVDGAVPASVLLPAPLVESQLTFSSAEPFREINRLREQGLQMRSVTVDRPNLEGVFLNLTGRKLRD